MDFEELVKYINYNQISFSAALIRLALAGLSGYAISGIYRLYHGKENSQTDMMHSLIFLSLIISSAMMIIGNNLASAFGLVGAVSIIRFRTSVKSARDMAFVFFTVVSGMSCGLGFLQLAIIGLVFTGLIMILVYFIIPKKKVESLNSLKLKISYSGILSDRVRVDNVLNDICSDNSLINLKVDEDRISLGYNISLVDMNSVEIICSAINNISKLKKVKILFADLEL